MQALCLGEAGCGKTTLAKQLFYIWSNNRSQYPKTKVTIFVTPYEEGENLEETVRNALPAKTEDKECIINLWKDEPGSVLLIFEAFDDFQNHAVIKETQQLIKDHCVNVFLTMRKDHPKLTTHFLSLFSHKIEINGFSQKDGASYADKFLKEMECSHDVQHFLDAIKGKPKFETNPLNLTLACQLYSEGELKSSEIETLQEVNLYTMRENRMVERECHESSYDNISEDISKLHKLALYKCIKGSMECTKSDLLKFNIELKSPVMVLLYKRNKYTAKNGHETFWLWPHSRLCEFDAAACITNMNLENCPLLYWIAERPSFNPITQLAIGILCRDNKYEEVKFMTIATALLQSKAQCSANQQVSNKSLHPCDWMRDVKKMMELLVNPETCLFDNHTNHQRERMQHPDYVSISKCCGSPFHENISLFKHVQHCWEVGLQDSDHGDFINSINNLFLPGMDRYAIIFHSHYKW